MRPVIYRALFFYFYDLCLGLFLYITLYILLFIVILLLFLIYFNARKLEWLSLLMKLGSGRFLAVDPAWPLMFGPWHLSVVVDENQIILHLWPNWSQEPKEHNCNMKNEEFII